MENNIDPRKLGIPNIQFSLAEDDSEFSEKYKKQRMERGFDDTETWNLNTTFANFMLPRLKAFREIGVPFGHPAILENEEEWGEIIDKIIHALELYLDEDNELEDEKEIQEGIDLFAKYFFNLWW